MRRAEVETGLSPGKRAAIGGAVIVAVALLIRSEVILPPDDPAVADSARASTRPPGIDDPGLTVVAGGAPQGMRIVLGVVLNPECRPAANAVVSAVGEELVTRAVRTDGVGRFRMELPRGGRVALLARKEGFVTREPACVSLDATHPFAHVEIQLVQAASISGRVEWADGRPITNASLRAAPAGTGDASTAGPLPSAQGQEERSFVAELRDMALSGPDGAFELTGIHPDYPYTITAFGRPDVPGTVEVGPVSAGAKDVRVVFR
jgi:hypothetical protein